MQQSIIRFILLFICCVSVNLMAQKGGKKVSVDSIKNLHRSGSKLPCPDLNRKEELIAKPLSYYNFYSQMEATYTFADSTNKVSSKTDYTFYFDDSSYFAALKETYVQSGKAHAYFRIEELKDSVEFKINLSDTSRLLQFKNTKNCKGNNYRFRTVIENRARYFEKTGQTKTILGFLCEEYILNNGQIKQSIWVCNTDDAWLTKVRRDMLTALYYEPVTFSKGLVFYSETITLQTGNKQIFAITRIQKNKPTRVACKGFKLKYGPYSAN